MPRSALATVIPLPSAAPSQLMSDLSFWCDDLRARNKSAATIESYTLTLSTFERFLLDRGYPVETSEITRQHVQQFMTDQLGKHSAGTANTRFAGLRAFFAFLVAQEELERTPMRGMVAPSMPIDPTPVMSVDSMRRLLDTCSSKTFADRRDYAIIRLLIDTGMRRAEIMGLLVEDVLVNDHLVVIRSETAKGRKARRAVFGAKAASALHKYLRMRRTHKHHASPFMWVSQMGASMDPPALNNMLAERSREAGLTGIHPHMFRHTAAHLQKSAGMQDGDLMRLMGWSSPEMLQRYGAYAADERAIKAATALGAPGDLV